MSTHPKHGVKPESEKIRMRASWEGGRTEFFKLLVRSPGTKVWSLRTTGFDLRRDERDAYCWGDSLEVVD